jgi:hypothetical protein
MGSIFDHDIDRIATNLMTTARIYDVPFDVAWNEYTFPDTKELITFEEVYSYIFKKFFPFDQFEKERTK